MIYSIKSVGLAFVAVFALSVRFGRSRGELGLG